MPRLAIIAEIAAGLIMLLAAGCGHEAPEVSDAGTSVPAYKAALPEEDESPPESSDEEESIVALYQDIYAEAANRYTPGSLEMMQCIVSRLGENGYAAVDSGNQVDMAEAEQVLEFCRAVEEKENGSLTVIVALDAGFRRFDMETEDGNVDIVRAYYQYDQNGSLQNRNTVSYPADAWQYTEEGYLLFEGSYYSDEQYVFTKSSGGEHTAMRVLPLEEKCRELNRNYILPVGYEQNNIFLTDWSEEDFGALDFYDIFARFYPDSGKMEIGADYKIPEETFENVIMAYFRIDRETLQSRTAYLPADGAYEYRTRGYYEAEYPDIPYPEVVSYTENQDGTIALIINAVYPHENTSRSYTHRTVVRPIDENQFQYVSNQMISPEGTYGTWWHTNRLSQEEWEELP